MRNHSILCSFLLCAIVSFAQDSEYEKMYKLSKVWIRQNEDAWTFGNHDLRVNQYNVEFNLYGDSLIVYEKDYDNSTEYELNYIENYFHVSKLTDEDLVIRPLNPSAVEFVDPQARYSYSDASTASRKAMYKTYVKELKAAGKDEVKRNAVLLRYKTKYALDVDVISFKPETYFVEKIKIDSVDVSLTWQVGLKENMKRIEYNDLRWVKETNSYVFGYRFEDRKVVQKVVNGTIEFVPPLVTDVEEPPGDQKEEKETAQDSLIRILNEAPAGWYTGKFASEGFSLLETALQKYGVNKPHQTGDKAHCIYAVRIYHQGKYTDYYWNEWENQSYLLEDFFVFLDTWVKYVRTFEKVQGKTILFPIALKN